MSNANAHKPGYKHTPLGWIPNEWDEVELGDIVDKDRPISYGIVQTGENMPNGVKCIRVVDIVNGRISADALITTSDEISRSYKRTVLKEGDVVMALRGKIGELAIIPEDLVGANLTRGVALIAVSSNYASPFIYQLLSSPFNKKLMERSLNGSALQELSIATVRNIPIVVPQNIEEQQKIATILSTWDEAIQKIQQLIEQLKRRNKGLMQQLLTGKKRLKGFSGKWKHIKLRQVASEVSIKNKEDKELTVLSCTKYDGLVDSLKYFGRRVFSEDTSTYKVVPVEHFAYATNHIEEGSIGYQTAYAAALISPMYTVFKTTADIDDNFLYKVLKSQHYIHEYQKRMEGSIDRRGGLRWNEFSKIPIAHPALEEQIAIAKCLDKANEELKLYGQQLANLQEQKKGLMQKLLSGEVRVIFKNKSYESKT